MDPRTAETADGALEAIPGLSATDLEASPDRAPSETSRTPGNGAPAEASLEDVPPEALLGQRRRRDPDAQFGGDGEVPPSAGVGVEVAPGERRWEPPPPGHDPLPAEVTIRQRIELPPQPAPPAAWSPPDLISPPGPPSDRHPSNPGDRPASVEERIEVAPRPQGRPQIRVNDPRCPYCHEAVATGEREQLACNRCRAWHHQECWTEANSRCSSCGSKSTGLFVPSSGVRPALPPRESPSRVRRWLRSLPGWVWALGGALVMVAVLASLVLSEVLLGEGFSWGVLLSTLFSAGSIWSAVVALWSSRPDPNDASYLDLPGVAGERTAQAREEIGRRFAQSAERFRTAGISLEEPDYLSLHDCLVVCMQRADNVHQLLSVLTPISNHRMSPPVILVTSFAGTEVLSMFETNIQQGSFAGFVISADREQLRDVARASGARLVKRGRAPTCRDVGRADITALRGGVDFVGPRRVARVPYRG